MKNKIYTLDLTNAILDDEQKYVFGKDRKIWMQTNRPGMWKEFEVILHQDQLRRYLRYKKRRNFKMTEGKYSRTTKKEAFKWFEEEKQNILLNGIGLNRGNIPPGAKIIQHFKTVKDKVIFENILRKAS